MTIPYTFAGATTAIPLSNLDANFASPVTLGNVAMTLSNTYTSIGNLTLTNVTISSASGLAANTVAYANASGVLGGSANMTFDGSTLTTLNTAYTGTLTGGTGIVNLGSGQFYKDASGNVGIGTSTINAKFQLQVGDVMPSASGNMATGVVIQAGSGSQALNIGTTVTNSYVWLNSAYANNSNSATPMVFMTGATERMRIDSSGNLLVGTTTQASTAKISIAGSVGATAGYLCHAGISAGNVFGNVFNFFWTSSSLQAWIDITNVGTVTLVSDYRIKKDIVTQDTPAIARINQLRPVTYERTDYKNLYKADGVAREGFIAHELQEIIPSAVEGEKDAENQIQSLSLDALCSVMVKAIQEQQALITDLQARLTKAGL